MANEPIYDVAVFDYKRRICSAQTVVETRLLPAGGVSITKVLSYSADCFAAATDVFTGEARCGGRVNFKVLFIDGESTVRSMELTTEFSDKITDDGIEGGKPYILSRILDIDIVKASEEEIKLAAIVEMDLFDNSNFRLRYLLSGDEVYTNGKEIEYSRLTAKAAGSVTVEAELNIEGEILLSEAKATLNKLSAGTDNVIAEGIIICEAVTQKEGKIYSYRVETPFSHEIAADGARQDMLADGSAVIRRYGATVTEGETATAYFAFETDITAFVYSTEVMTPVTDVFSVVNELNVTKTEVPVIKSLNTGRISERVEGAVTLENEMPIADNILCGTGNNLRIANAYINEGKVVLEGAVTSSVIYFSGESNSINSVDVELPFSIMTNYAAEGDAVFAEGIVTELSAKLRRGNEIDIKADIAVSVYSSKTETASVITNLTLGEKIEIPATAISLHIGKKNETLWELAKALRTTPELVLLQNPDISLPLSGGERIIVYRQLKKN